MKKIVIIGGGFAGMAAARRLRRDRRAEVSLLDPRTASEFLPLLPDMIGRNMPGRLLRADFSRFLRPWGVHHHQTRAVAVDMNRRVVQAESGNFPFDYLVVCCGSETNFRGGEEAARTARKLDGVDDAETILRDCEDETIENFVVVGGGYTGVEVATHLWRRFRQTGARRGIVLAEFSDHLCPILPPGFQEYVARNVRGLGIEVRTGATFDSWRDGALALTNGETWPRARLIWCAGVKTPALVDNLPGEKARGGRLIVQPNLAFADGCYAAGDAAAFMRRGEPLRMGIQFSLSQGRHAAANILRQIAGRAPRPFHPFDPGFLTPLANMRACGFALGVPVKGLPASLLHYFMCVFRTWSHRAQAGIVRHLITGR